MRAIILTGAPGAGKSAALGALGDALAQDRVPHVTIDLDDLARGWPWRHPPASYAGLAGFLSAQPTDLLLITATLTSAAEVEGLLRAIGCDEHRLVRLHARPQTLRARVRARETVPWSGLDALVERAPALQEQIARLDAHLVIDGEDGDPVTVAGRIRAALAL